MVNNLKKAISPVVATALLLVVAVVAVVAFQTWFAGFQSSQQSSVESKSNSGSSLTIERLERTTATTATVYYRNIATSDVDVTEIKILNTTATQCSNTTVSDGTASSVNSTTLAGCTLTKDVEYNVVLVTTTGVYQEDELVR